MAECLDDETIAALIAWALPKSKADDVRAHVSACPRCRRLLAGAIAAADLDTAIAPTMEAVPQATRFARDPFAAGSLIAGKYRIERVLGAGGFGRVLEATQLDLERRIAMKVLHDPSDAERFVREAKIIASLESKHAVRVFDFGMANGEPYLVMELLEGEDLATLAQRRQLSFEEARSFMLDACEALGEAHARGIVHRDLKPSNLFLAKTPSGPCLKVLDFGVAKVKDSTATTSDAIIGTPAFMSPEQLFFPQKVDARSDIFSLGATVYSLCHGQAFRGQSNKAIESVLLGKVPSLHEVRPDIPKPFADLVARCLKEDREARFGSIEELRAALRALDLSKARPTSRVFLLALGGSVLVGGVLAAAIVPSWGGDRDRVTTVPSAPAPSTSATVDEPVNVASVAPLPTAAPSTTNVHHHAAPASASVTPSAAKPIAGLKIFTNKFGARGMTMETEAAKRVLVRHQDVAIRCLATHDVRKANVVIRINARGEGRVVQGGGKAATCLRDALGTIQFTDGFRAESEDATYDLDVDFAAE